MRREETEERDEDVLRLESSRVPLIIGLVIGGVFLLLLATIVGAVLVYLRRGKPDPDGKDALASNE